MHASANVFHENRVHHSRLQQVKAYPAEKTFAAAIVALLLTSLFVRLMLATGPVGSDDSNYYNYAQKVLAWEHFDTLHHHGGRLAFLVLVGFPAVLFGSVQAGAVVNVLYYLLRDLFIILYAKKRLGARAALVSGLVLAVNPISLLYAGTLLPDGLLSLFMAASAILAFEAASGRKHAIWMMAGSGFCAWAAYSAKDTGLLILPCVAAILFLPRPHSIKGIAGFHFVAPAVLVGVFALFSLMEMYVYHRLSGDWLYRFHAISTTHNTYGDVTTATSLFDFARMTYWNLYSVTRVERASLAVLLLGLVVWLLDIRKSSLSRFFPLTGAFLAVYLIFGTSSFSRLIPLPVQDRYFEVIVPFVAMSVAAIFATAGPRARAPWARMAALFGAGLLSLASIIANGGANELADIGKNAAQAVIAVQKADPAHPVFVSPKLHFVLRTFLPDDTYSKLRQIRPEDVGEPGFYLLHPRMDSHRQLPWVTEVRKLPVYAVINENRRFFRFGTKPEGRDDTKAVVWVRHGVP